MGKQRPDPETPGASVKENELKAGVTTEREGRDPNQEYQGERRVQQAP